MDLAESIQGMEEQKSGRKDVKNIIDAALIGALGLWGGVFLIAVFVIVLTKRARRRSKSLELELGLKAMDDRGATARGADGSGNA